VQRPTVRPWSGIARRKGGPRVSALTSHPPPGLSVVPGCQIAYMEHTAILAVINWCSDSSLPGVRLLTWNILAVINWCSDSSLPGVRLLTWNILAVTN
jgi:hypothetical protein